MNELDYLNDVIDALKPILLPHGITKWLDTPVQELRWATPLEAINRGSGPDVVELVSSYNIVLF